MFVSNINQRLTDTLRSMSFVDINLARVTTAALATAKVWWYLKWVYQVNDDVSFSVCVDPSYTRIHLSMTIALVVCLICLLFCRAITFHISTLSLIWVSFMYAAWFKRGYISSNEKWVECSGYPNVFNVCGATYWDAAMFALFLALALWHIRIFLNVLFTRSR